MIRENCVGDIIVDKNGDRAKIYMYDRLLGYIGASYISNGKLVSILPWEFKNGDWRFIDAPVVKCTCGTSITMGKDDLPDYHSDWCDTKGGKK